MNTYSTVKAADGFTLVEVMIVVLIIGLVAAIAIPSFAKARLNSKASAQMNDLRVLDGAFQQYAMELHGFPAGVGTPGVLPPGMGAYLKTSIWSNAAVCGGSYAWKQTTMNGSSVYYISLVGNVDEQAWSLVDQKMDDGDPAAGKIQTGPLDHAYFIDQ